MKILFLNFPFFDLRYQVHKEMGGGVGFKNLKSSIDTKHKIYPIVDLINAATITSKKFDASLIDSQFFNFRNSNDYINYII